MFQECTNLKEINFPNINAFLLNDISHMFYKCTNLKSINMQGLKSEILYMNWMFSGCKNLKYLNIYNLDSRKLVSLESIFEGIENKINITYDPEKTSTTLQKAINKVILE